MEIEHLSAGEPAPFDGYLLSERLLIVLYSDAERRSAEEAAAQLRRQYAPEP